MSKLRLSELSASRQTLVRLCQQMGLGKIVCLLVRDGEPVFTSDTELLLDMKLDGDEILRPERDLSDFVLCAEIVRLFSNLDGIRNGVVDHVEVRAGIPRRIVFRAPVSLHR